MKIKYCILSTNLNRDYYEFVPIICKIWKELLDIEAKIIFIGNEIPEELNEFKTNMILFRPIDGIHTAFQAQCIRVLYPALLNTDDGVMVADIDMFPLRQEYYEGFEKIDKNKIITPSILHGRKQILMSCMTACPLIWRDIFNINNEDDIINTLKLWHQKYSEYDGKRGGTCWNADQEILYEYVTNWNDKTNNLYIYEKKNVQFKNMRSEMKSLNASKNEIKMKNFFEKIMKPEHPYIQLCKPYSNYKFILDWLCDMILNYYK